MIVYKTSDKIPVKIGKFTVVVSPLSASQYASVMGLKSGGVGNDTESGVKMALLALKYAVKGFDSEIKVEYSDGSTFKLGFDELGFLNDDSLDSLVQIMGPVEMTLLANKVLVNQFKALDGAEIEKTPSKSKKKN